MGGAGGLQPGGPDQDRHRRQRAGPQHARARRRRHRAGGAAGGWRAAWPPADLRGPGPGDRRHQPGAQGRLHHPGRPRAGARRRPAAGERVRHRVAPRRRHPRRRSRGGSDACWQNASLVAARAGRRRRSAPRAGRRWRWRSGSAPPRRDGGNVALVVTELATNLVRHGGGGELLVAHPAERRGRDGDRGDRPRSGHGERRAGPPRRLLHRRDQRRGLGAVRADRGPVRDLFGPGRRHGRAGPAPR